MAKDKRVLVTGGTGLVGKGIEMAIHSPSYKGNLENEEWIFLGSKEGDLRKYEDTKKIFDKYKPTHVIHLAALVGGLFKNMRLKLQFYNDNHAINSNILQCAQEAKVEKLISCLSTCIFPDKTPYPIDETMVHNGAPHPSNEGYAYAKRMLEVQTRLYNEQFGTNFVTVIPTNIFGPYDNYNLEDSHVIPGLIHKCHIAMSKGTDFVVWGSGKPLRQFIFSKDLGELFVWVMNEYKSSEPIILSVGEEDEVSIGDVAKMVAEAMNFKGNVVFDTSKADGQFKKTASNKKLMTLNPNVKFTPIKEAIKQSVDWFEQNFDKARK